MLDQLNEAIEAYHQKWHKLIAARANKDFFTRLRPTAVAWKVADRAEYDRILAELHDYCDIVDDVWLNERWIATMHLRGIKLSGDIEIIKLMQRRPGSDDAVGLDHIDWYGSDVASANDLAATETDLKLTPESNGPNCSWISLWFDGTEAKLRTDTVVDSCIRELRAVNEHILAKD